MSKKIIRSLEGSLGSVTRVGLIVALMYATVSAAEVMLANGQVIEGSVQGRVLVSQITSDGEVGVRVVEGRDISRIDASGVHGKGESVFLLGMKGATPGDVLQGLIWWDEGRGLRRGQGLVRNVGTAQVVGTRVPDSSLKSVSGKFLGEYRIDQRRKEIELLGTIRLKQANGTMITIPVAEIVRVKE